MIIDKTAVMATHSPTDSLRLAAVDALGCVIAHDDIILLCDASPALLDHIFAATLDRSDAVARATFDSLAHLFQEFESKRLSHLTGDKLNDTENSLTICSKGVVTTVDVIWLQLNALMARSLILPIESFRATVFPLVYAAKTVASGAIDIFHELSKIAAPPDSSSSIDKLVEIFDVVSQLLSFLSSLDPPLVFEVRINILLLADILRGKLLPSPSYPLCPPTSSPALSMTPTMRSPPASILPSTLPPSHAEATIPTALPAAPLLELAQRCPKLVRA